MLSPVIAACAFGKQCEACVQDNAVLGINLLRHSYLPEAIQKTFRIDVCHPMCEETIQERCVTDDKNILSGKCDCIGECFYYQFLIRYSLYNIHQMKRSEVTSQAAVGQQSERGMTC